MLHNTRKRVELLAARLPSGYNLPDLIRSIMTAAAIRTEDAARPRMTILTDLPVALVVMSGPYDGQRYVLHQPRDPLFGYVLGRRSDCDWAFSYDDQLSGKHARLFRAEAGWFIEDLKSTNHTYLARTRPDHSFAGREALPPQQPHPIPDGQLLQLGRLWLRCYWAAVSAMTPDTAPLSPFDR